VSITCPVCGATSHHAVDEREGYCGHCHDWTAHTWDHIAPRRAPGGLWARVTAGRRILDEHALEDPGSVEAQAVLDATLSSTAIDAGADEVRVFFYDGDTGECVGTLVVVP
jgi:hypothetical protein